MAFKFIVKDENLPKPTILSTIHVISFLALMPIFSMMKDFIPKTIIPILVLEIIQIIYSAVFYRKLVWERYADLRLRTVTISFIATNVSCGILTILDQKFGFSLSLTQILISLFLVFIATIPITIYCRKINLLDRVKNIGSTIRTFSFPFYKITSIIPMFFVLPSMLIKAKVYIAISLILLVLGMIYSAFGEYFYTKRKDELDRLIKYEASFIAMQFLPAIFTPLFLLETFWKI